MTPTIATLQSLGHGTPDGQVLLILHRTISAQAPDHRPVAISVAEKLSVCAGVLRREYLRAHPPLLVYFVTPGWQHADEQPQLIGSVDDVVHVLKVSGIRPRGIVVDQRQVPVRIGLNKS